MNDANRKKLKAIRHNVKMGGLWNTTPPWLGPRIQIVTHLKDRPSRQACLGAIFGKPSTTLLSNGEAYAAILAIRFGWFTDDFVAFLTEEWTRSRDDLER